MQMIGTARENGRSIVGGWSGSPKRLHRDTRRWPSDSPAIAPSGQDQTARAQQTRSIRSTAGAPDRYNSERSSDPSKLSR
jgi:hypothetical protein